MPSRIFPICLYREAMHLQIFYAYALCEWVWPRTHRHDVLYPICSKLQYRDPEHTCIVWLYYVCKYTSCRLYYVCKYTSCSLFFQPPSQLWSAVHWKACFSVCDTAKLGTGPGDKAMSPALLCGDFRVMNFFSWETDTAKLGISTTPMLYPL